MPKEIDFSWGHKRVPLKRFPMVPSTDKFVKEMLPLIEPTQRYKLSRYKEVKALQEWEREANNILLAARERLRYRAKNKDAARGDHDFGNQGINQILKEAEGIISVIRQKQERMFDYVQEHGRLRMPKDKEPKLGRGTTMRKPRGRRL